MDVLEEKVNGGPSMDIIEEVISVRDRKHLSSLSDTSLTSDISC